MVNGDVVEFAKKVQLAGGRALLVGGCVRDMLMYGTNRGGSGVVQMMPTDYDFEIFGVPMENLREILSQFGPVDEVGKHFGVMKSMSRGWDVALPRTESKCGPKHQDFVVESDHALGYEEAARRRDLTINSVSFDPIEREFIDPLGGISDIVGMVLRMSDPTTFGDDPLRALRVAQFASRFPSFSVDEATLRMVGAQPIHELPAERVFSEFKKMLLGAKPSRGFDVLRDSGLLRYFPWINELRDVPQDPGHHPEGCVYTHTMMVIDRAAKMERMGNDDFDLPLMFGALCHDFGKPMCTGNKNGRIHTRGHEDAGASPTREFMSGLKAPNRLIQQVEEIVIDHLRPQLMPDRAKMKGYRRLRRRLDAAGVSPALLAAVSRADTQGRGTPDHKKEKSINLNKIFLVEMLKYTDTPSEMGGFQMDDAVTGKHLIAIGMEPGVEMGELLKTCRWVQDEIGMAHDPGFIIRYALSTMGVEV